MANSLFQNALNKTPQKVPPIWFMRQAGRYHSHYQNLRKLHSFDQLCKVADLAAEVALGPVLDFDFDVAILFSDILFPLEALGFGLQYSDSGPKLDFHLDVETIHKMKPAVEVKDFLNFQGDAVKLTRERLPKDKSLVGFIGGPWTLFVYACEGGHSGSLTKTKSLLPFLNQFEEQLLILLEHTIQRQLNNGAEIVMIFDTAAGELSPALFNTFVLPSLKRLTKKFPNHLGYYSKGTQSSFFNNEFLSLPWAGMGFDHRWDLPAMMKSTLPEVFNVKTGFIQGNFDQSLLHADFDSLKKYVSIYLDSWKELSIEQRAGWVAGLGHGVLPKTPEAHVKYLIQAIRKGLS
ncbi:MAG: uroporphyrinogen decarboxylase family protein [Pseudobdellovibrio sp.]